MSQHMYSEIQINTPSSEVRKHFLDFPSIPKWHKGFTITIRSPQPPSNPSLPPTPSTLKPGTRLQITTNGTILHPLLLENAPSSFIWQGSFYGLLTGKHIFRFLDDEREGEREGERERDREGCKFVQEEEMSGVLAFLFSSWWPKWLGGMRAETERVFGVFNGGLKGWVEEGKGVGGL